MLEMGSPGADADQLRHVLLESRQRWRDFGALASDVVFEVDGAGAITFISPDEAFGLPADELSGRRAADLFFPAETDGPDPFLLSHGFRDRRSWIDRPQGRPLCVSLSAAPLFDGSGRCIGARVVGSDVTVRERRDAAAAAALRRVEVLDHVMDQMRQEVLAPRIMSALLMTALRALGGSGAVVLELNEFAESGPVLHEEGASSEPHLPELLQALQGCTRVAPNARSLQGGVEVISCQSMTRFSHKAALAIWRSARDCRWDADDLQLLGSITALVRVVLEHETIQRELARQARTDALTGLLNRRAFMEEAQRRVERLDQDRLPATVMFVDLDRFKPLNDRLGHEAGDNALVLAATTLRRVVRPTDLVARFGGDEFALWLDGFDSLTAAERAEALRLDFPKAAADFAEPGVPGLTMSIGIACREPGHAEELENIIQRADLAMYEVKRRGGGGWRVSHLDHVS